MSVIPCEKNDRLEELINEFTETLKTDAHRLGTHGLTENDFYNGGLFRGAIERARGQFAASMSVKREFVRHVLNYMQDRHLITTWESSGGANRHDYVVTMPTGRITGVELKGCLDGNNTTIFSRPANAQEFVIWSVCTNPGADPRKNAWSGIHTRLSAEIVSNGVRVDGVAIWDMVCGTIGRPCPKVVNAPERMTDVGPYKLPPPCLYVFPGTIPTPRNNPLATAQALDDVQFFRALHTLFHGRDEEVNYVDFEVQHFGAETQRRTRIRRGGNVVKASPFTELRRE